MSIIAKIKEIYIVLHLLINFKTFSKFLALVKLYENHIYDTKITKFKYLKNKKFKDSWNKQYYLNQSLKMSEDLSKITELKIFHIYPIHICISSQVQKLKMIKLTGSQLVRLALRQPSFISILSHLLEFFHSLHHSQAPSYLESEHAPPSLRLHGVARYLMITV